MHSSRVRVCGPRAFALAACAYFLAGSASAQPVLRFSQDVGAPSQSADLVLRGGRIVTVEDELPEVRALAARDGRIVYLGDESGTEAWIGPNTRVVELNGAFAMPGFIEGHGHFLGIGDAKMNLDLMAVNSFEEIVELVRRAVAESEPGQLIRGRGWHQEKWDSVPSDAVEGLPRHDALSRVSPQNPVVLTHASGHAVMANARAMEICSIDRNSVPPDGGEMVCDAAGDPIGVFRETASGMLNRVRFNARPPDPRRQAELAAEEVLRKGVTSFQDAGSGFGTVELLRDMAEKGELGVRLWVMLRTSNRELAGKMAATRMVGFGNHHLTVRAVKHSIDGALGSHGAWLLEPYADLPESSGLNTTSLATIEESAQLCLEHDFQLCVHAIGDRANREVLDLFERATGERGRALRWRIEHAQHLHPDDVPRFADQGVIASMQGVHCTSDGPWVFERLGPERAQSGAYVWRDLLDSGAVVTNGTDAPVEDVDPIASFYSTVSRRMKDGTPFFAEQAMTRAEALRSYTLAPAYAAFEEDVKGSLKLGKLADVTVLDRDLLTCEEAEIPGARVLYTIVGGEVRYAANSAAADAGEPGE